MKPSIQRALFAAGFAAALAALLGAEGCASHGVIETLDTTPYKAVVVFEWPDAAPPGAAAGEVKPAAPVVNGGGADASGEASASAPASPPFPPDRAGVENEILHGLTGYRVFSSLVAATPEDLDAVADKEKADLILKVKISQLASWEHGDRRIHAGLAVLDAVLWITTAFGGWWIPTVEFPTHSNFEVSWRRPIPEGKSPVKSAAKSAAKSGSAPAAGGNERFGSGDYRLSFWDRARPWRYPWTYLSTIIIPPALVPFSDDQEVNSSLTRLAIEDFKRELARKLKGGGIHAAGSPLLFQLKEPANEAPVSGPSASIRFRYQVQGGFDEKELKSLTIEVKPAGKDAYLPPRRYTDAQIRAINQQIAKDEEVSETVEGLEPGWNLIHFTAQTDQSGIWITNTVAVLRR